MEYIDLNVYVLRQNYTKRELINYANSFYDSGKIKNLSLVLNYVDFTNNYGYNYNYNYDYEFDYDSSYYDED